MKYAAANEWCSACEHLCVFVLISYHFLFGLAMVRANWIPYNLHRRICATAVENEKPCSVGRGKIIIAHFLQWFICAIRKFELFFLKFSVFEWENAQHQQQQQKKKSNNKWRYIGIAVPFFSVCITKWHASEENFLNLLSTTWWGWRFVRNSI